MSEAANQESSGATGPMTARQAGEALARMPGIEGLFDDEPEGAGAPQDDGGEALEAEGSEVEETEELEAEAETDGGEEAADSGEAEPDEDSGDHDNSTPVETVTEMAEVLGLDVDELRQSLTDTVIVNGEEITVNLEGMRKGHQLERDYRQKTAEHNEDVRAKQAQHAQRMADAEAHLQATVGMVQQVEQALLAGYDDASMSQLRMQDEVAWQTRMIERQRIGEFLGNLHQQADAQRNQMQAQAAQYMQELQASEGAKLREVMPDLDGQRLAAWVTQEFGYTAEEISRAADHRLFAMAERARRAEAKLAEIEAQGNLAEKKVKTLPPTLKKAKKQRTPKQLSADKVRSIKMRAKASGSRRDAAAGIEAVLGDKLL